MFIFCDLYMYTEYEYRAEYKKIDDRITESCRIETERQRRLPEKTYLSIQVVPDNPTELESSKITANMKQSNPEQININYKHVSIFFQFYFNLIFYYIVNACTFVQINEPLLQLILYIYKYSGILSLKQLNLKIIQVLIMQKQILLLH